jgi:signal transduction histidine kinase
MARVLIVDDQEINRCLLRTVLEQHGFEVDEASDGERALDCAGRRLPDLVISDLLMPVMDGYTLLRHWREDARFHRIPFIVHTGTYNSAQDRKLAFDLGADAYLRKFMDRDDFIAGVREVLESARQGTQKQRALVADADEQLREYSAVLVHKLEAKSEQLERTNERLQRLSQRLLEVQEAERAAIARELHDEIGQALTAIKLSAQWVQKRTGEAESLRLADCIALADQALAQVRNLALELRPPQLDQLGLTAALRDLTRRIAASAGIEFEFAADAYEVLPGYAQATAAFRIVQEALTNVVRHAGATRVKVELHRHGNELTVSVEDDGRAFDAESALSSGRGGGSLGLIGMQERASLAGGWLRIDAKTGRGTRVSAGFAIEASAPGSG